MRYDTLFGMDGQTSTPTEGAYGILDNEASHNMAEYQGLISGMHRAAWRAQCNRLCFQVDSMLVARHVQRQWACRSTRLQPLLQQVWDMLRTWESNGVVVIVEHIYREFNAVTDAVANRALDGQLNQDWVVY